MAGTDTRPIGIPQHILLIHQGAIGDLILSLPCFYAMRTTFPDARIEVMGYPGILSLVHQRFYADEISSIDKAAVASLYQERGELNTEIIQYLRRFARVVVFGSKAQAVVVNNIRRVLEQRDVWQIKPIPEMPETHVIDFQLRQLAQYGVNTANALPTLYFRTDDLNQADSFLRSHGFNEKKRSRIAIHPGSGSKQKNWMLECYGALIRDIYQRYKEKVLIVQGPADCHEIKLLSGLLYDTAHVVLRCLDLPMLGAIFSRCHLFIGNDSGITHLAAAAGVPTIAVFGPTDPHMWGPRGRQVFIIREFSAEQAGWKWCSTDRVKELVLRVLERCGF